MYINEVSICNRLKFQANNIRVSFTMFAVLKINKNILILKNKYVIENAAYVDF